MANWIKGKFYWESWGQPDKYNNLRAGDPEKSNSHVAYIAKDSFGAISITDDDAERLLSSLNACIPFEHPEQDIKKLVEALKLLLVGSELDGNKRILARNCPSNEAILKGFEALALVKE